MKLIMLVGLYQINSWSSSAQEL